MKVVFLNDSMCGGGAEKAMANIVNVLAQEMEIDVISLENNFCIPLSPRIRQHFFHQTITFRWQKLLGLITDAYRLKTFVKRNGQHTVVSFQYRSNFINIIAKILGSKHRVIVSERNYPKHALAYLPFFKLLLKKLYPLADMVICNASDTKTLLCSEYGLTNVKLIFNGYDKKEILMYANKKIPDKYIKIFKKDVILNIGRLTEQKGHIYLLQAFAKMAKSYNLVILGEGSLRNKLEKIAQELNIEKRVFFLGYQKNPYSFLKRANVFVFTSLYEGFPNALSEAIICGVPVASFDFKAGANDLMEKKDLVPIKDITSLVHAIEHAKIREDKTLSIDEVARQYMGVLMRENI